MSNQYAKKRQEAKRLPHNALAILMTAALDRNAQFRFIAPGFSMMPFIRDGDVLTIASGRPRFGDVVAFRSSCQDRLTVHRVVHVSPSGYLIKGDNTTEPDGRLPGACIIGRVIRVEHCGRRVRVGMGIERVVIAWLSRRGWLMPVVRNVWRVASLLAKR